MMKCFLKFGLVCFITGVLSHPEDFTDYCSEHLLTGDEPANCLDLLCRGFTWDGVYEIYPEGKRYHSFNVYCDQTSNGGGWTVFQKRMDGSVDFFQNWQNYKNGFGDVNSEHWLGLDKIAQLSSALPQKLRVDLEDFNNTRKYAEYSSFKVEDSSQSYKLTVTGYFGDAGDSMLSAHNSQKFTTKDRDLDTHSGNCATSYKGGWWYGACHASNLNGLYLAGDHSSYANGVNWYHWRGHHHSLKTTSMKMRPLV